MSRVLNNTGRVGPATRERILRIAAQLHYAPNAAARSLASRRSRTIGAVIPSLENLNFAIAIDRFRKTLREHGYTLLLANSDYDPDKEAAQIKAIAAHGVDAVMLIGASHSAQALAFLAARRVPVLLTWNWQPHTAAPGDDALPCIGFDNFQAATQLTEYLLEPRTSLAGRDRRQHREQRPVRRPGQRRGRGTRAAWLAATAGRSDAGLVSRGRGQGCLAPAHGRIAGGASDGGAVHE